jgi:hypothetical protein
MHKAGVAGSFSDNLDQHPLPAPSIELAVKDLLPGAEIEATIGDRHHHFSPHDLPLEVCVAVVLAGAVVPVAPDRLVGGQFFQPVVVILVQAAFVVVDEHRRGDVHGVDQDQSLLYAIPQSPPSHSTRL